MPRNVGVRAEFNPENRFPETGQCVHKFAMAAGEPDTLYQRNHCGVYRSDDGSETWQEITGDLPTDFGFSLVAHPRDPDTCWLIPLSTPEEGRYMPDGHTAVWRTRDRGGSWTRLGRRPADARRVPVRAARGDGPRHARPGRDHLRDEHRPALAQQRRRATAGG